MLGVMTDRIIERGGLWQGGRLLVFDSLPSTNSWAVRNAGELRHGDIVAAVAQTAGRGRFDRAWLMPAGAGVALTVALRNVEREEVFFNIGRAAALAVRECLAGFDVDSAVKWPNDVVAGGRKICGILAERDSGVLLLGIGLNVNVSASAFKAAGLDGIATSMLIERGGRFDVEEVRAALIASLGKWVGGLLQDGPAFLEEAWSACDWLTGGAVEIDTASGLRRGRYAGVNQDGPCGSLMAPGRNISSGAGMSGRS